MSFFNECVYSDIGRVPFSGKKYRERHLVDNEKRKAVNWIFKMVKIIFETINYFDINTLIYLFVYVYTIISSSNSLNFMPMLML